MDKTKPMRHTMSFYAIFLKDEKNCEVIYGNTKYGYDRGDVVCFAPGQVIGVENMGVFQPSGYALFFDPELIHGTSLGKHIKEYSFFSYEVNEALHLSEEERQIFLGCLKMISTELSHSIDRLSKRVITGYIEVLLNYCLRFYERQFETRKKIDSDLLVKFENILNNYFTQNNISCGLPTVARCASELCLSPNYFGDLIKKETGITAKDYIKKHVIEATKEALANPDKTVTEVSYEIGFQYPQHMSRMFKQETGMTPAQYRAQLIA